MVYSKNASFNPLKPELNSICCLLALLGAHHFLHVSRIGVKLLTFRLLMSYTWSVRKVSDRILLCEHLMDYNLARLHEPTLNLSAHA